MAIKQYSFTAHSQSSKTYPAFFWNRADVRPAFQLAAPTDTGVTWSDGTSVAFQVRLGPDAPWWTAKTITKSDDLIYTVDEPAEYQWRLATISGSYTTSDVLIYFVSESIS